MIEITDSQFTSEVINSPIPVLVDLYAPWCGPCKALAKVLDGLEGDYEGRLKLVKLDTDSITDEALMARLAVRSVPSLRLFNNGVQVSTLTGLHPLHKILEFIDDAVM